MEYREATVQKHCWKKAAIWWRPEKRDMECKVFIKDCQGWMTLICKNSRPSSLMSFETVHLKPRLKVQSNIPVLTMTRFPFLIRGDKNLPKLTKRSTWAIMFQEQKNSWFSWKTKHKKIEQNCRRSKVWFYWPFFQTMRSVCLQVLGKFILCVKNYRGSWLPFGALIGSFWDRLWLF